MPRWNEPSHLPSDISEVVDLSKQMESARFQIKEILRDLPRCVILDYKGERGITSMQEWYYSPFEQSVVFLSNKGYCSGPFKRDVTPLFVKKCWWIAVFDGDSCALVEWLVGKGFGDAMKFGNNMVGIRLVSEGE